MYHSLPAPNEYPCLFFTKSELPALRAKLEHPDCAAAWRRLVAAGEDRIQAGPSALAVRRFRASQLAFVALLTGREEFVRPAIELAMAAATAESWIAPAEAKRGASVGLNTGHAVAEMALVYDWLHPWLDEQQKEAIRDATNRLGFAAALHDYESGVPLARYYTTNGIGVAYGPLLMAALLYEDAMDTRAAFELTLKQVRCALEAHCQDGGYSEGLLYWNYSLRHLLMGIEPLRRLKGIDLYHEPFLRHTANYPLHTILPGLTRCSAAADATSHTKLWPPVAALASYHQRPDWQWLARRMITHDWGQDGECLEYSLFFLLFYNPEIPSAPPTEAQTTWLFSGLQQLTLRSDWSDEAIHLHWLNGPSNCHHNHLHLNSFTLSAFGERLLVECGKYDYSNNQDYRKQTSGHNSLLVDGEGQIITTDNSISCLRIRRGEWGTVYGEFENLLEEAGATIATGVVVNAYQDRLRTFDRTLAFLDKRFIFLHDHIELSGDPPAELTWHFHSGGSLEWLGSKALFAAGAARLVLHPLCSEPLRVGIRDDHTKLNAPEVPIPYLVMEATANQRTIDLYALLMPYREHDTLEYDLEMTEVGARFSVGVCEWIYDAAGRKLTRVT